MDLRTRTERVAALREYFSQEGGLFEVTLAVCGYDPGPWRRYAEKRAEETGLNEGLMEARKFVLHLERHRLLRRHSTLYSGIAG